MEIDVDHHCVGLLDKIIKGEEQIAGDFGNRLCLERLC